MAQTFSKPFYHSAQWLAVREAYAKSKCYICERCGDPGVEVHHIVPLTASNITDPSITTSWENLRLLCSRCHREIHAEMDRGQAGDGRYTIDEEGNVHINEEFSK